MEEMGREAVFDVGKLKLHGICKGGGVWGGVRMSWGACLCAITSVGCNHAHTTSSHQLSHQPSHQLLLTQLIPV